MRARRQTPASFPPTASSSRAASLSFEETDGSDAEVAAFLMHGKSKQSPPKSSAADPVQRRSTAANGQGKGKGKVLSSQGSSSSMYKGIECITLDDTSDEEAVLKARNPKAPLSVRAQGKQKMLSSSQSCAISNTPLQTGYSFHTPLSGISPAPSFDTPSASHSRAIFDSSDAGDDSNFEEAGEAHARRVGLPGSFVFNSEPIILSSDEEDPAEEEDDMDVDTTPSIPALPVASTSQPVQRSAASKPTFAVVIGKKKTSVTTTSSPTRPSMTSPSLQRVLVDNHLSSSQLKRRRQEFHIEVPLVKRSKPSELSEKSLVRLLDETDGKGKPERRLDSFHLADSSSTFHPLLHLNRPRHSLILTGTVLPLNVVPAEHEAPIAPVKNFSLTEIIAVQPDADWNFWVETKSAWYRLGEPSIEYEDSKEWRESVKYLWLFVAARRWGLRMSKWDVFCGEWKKKSIRGTDEPSKVAYKLEDDDLVLKGSELLGWKHDLLRDLKEVADWEKKTLVAKDLPVLVTKSVYQIAHKYCRKGTLESLDKPDHQELLDAALQEAEYKSLLHDLLMDYDDSDDVRVAPRKRDAARHGKNEEHFSEITVNGERYGLQDCIAVVPENFVAAEFRSAPEALPWLGRVEYFYRKKKDGEIFVHLQWFEYGHDTYVGRLSPIRQLFLMDSCHDLPASEIVGKVDVRLREPGKPAPEIGFYYQFTYDTETSTYADALTIEELRPTPLCEAASKRSCLSCERREEEKAFNVPRWEKPLEHDDYAFLFQGERYDLGEDVYVFESEDRVFEVGRIIAIAGAKGRTTRPRPNLAEGSQVTIQYYRRRPDLLSNLDLDDRELVFTNTKQSMSCTYLKGHATVEHRSRIVPKFSKREGSSSSSSSLIDFRRVGGNFIVRDQLIAPNPMFTALDLVGYETSDLCELTRAEHEGEACERRREARSERFNAAKEVDPIHAIDLFAGAGGSTQGFREAGVKTVVAVESHFPAAQVFKYNHPHVNVLNRDVNEVLRGYELDRQGLVHADGRIARPTERIGLVYGSPPCGPHSNANGKKKHQDPRETLALTVPSFVESFKPDHFVLENVKQMLGAFTHDEGAKRGDFCRLLVQCFLTLGYQVQFGAMCADAYGVPQGRVRLFMLGTRAGRSMAMLPSPTSVSHKHTPFITHMKDSVKFTSDVCKSTGQGRAAPHLVPTFRDVTSDLPQFEYENPEKVMGPLPRRSVPAYPYNELHLHSPTSYGTAPLTPYQEVMRVGRPSEDSSLTCHHVARSINPLQAERMWHVPVNGDHRDLPDPLKLGMTGKGKVKRLNYYRRINIDKSIHTLITTVNVNGGGHGPNVHSHQHRLITVREAARGQGFQDGFNFAPPGFNFSVDEQYKFIGNAVPPPLAFAIGHQILDSIVTHHLSS